MSQPAQLSQHRSRLPRAFSALLGAFGTGWLALTLLSLTSGGPMDLLRAANTTANLAASGLVCAVAWLGTRPRPVRPLTGAQLTAVVVVGALPAAFAAAEGFLGIRQQVATSAGADLLAATIVGIAVVAVARSRPQDR